MIYTFVHSPLWYLQRLHDSSSEDQILTLKQELRFMRTYLIYLAMSKAMPSGSNSIINNVEAAFINSTKDLSSACFKDSSAVGSVVCHLLEKVKDIEQEIRKDYSILWDQPWKSNTPPLRLSVMEFVDSVLDNLEDLLSLESLIDAIRKNIQSLKEKLSFIKNILDMAEKKRVVHQKMGAFLIYVQVVATRAACLSYWSWIDEMDETKASRMDVKFSDLMQLIKPGTSDRVDMYFELLKASKSIGSHNTMVDEDYRTFVHFLLENSVTSIKDKITAIHKELMYLVQFLIELPDQCRDDLRQISADIKTVVKEAGSFHVNKVRDDQVEEMNAVLSRLLQKMMLIKEKMSQVQLQSSETSVMVHVDDQFLDLNEELESQSTFSVDASEEKKEDEKPLSTHSETAAIDVTSLTYSIYDNLLTGEMAMKIRLAIFTLLEKIEVIKLDMYAIEQQNHKADMEHPIKDQFESLHKGLKFLGKFLMHTTNIEDEVTEGKLFLSHLVDVINGSSSVISSFHVNQMTADKTNEVNLSILKLLGKIIFIKSESFMQELENHETGLMVHMKDQVENLQEGLRFLISFIMNRPREYKEEEELILKKSETLADEATSLICSFCEKVMKEGVAIEMKLTISESLRKIVLLKENIKRVCLQVPLSLHSNLPDALVFVRSLFENMRTLLNHKVLKTASMKHHIEMLLADLESLQFFLVDTADLRDEHEELKDLWTCIADVAREAEYMIDASVFGDDPDWKFMLWLPFATENIKVVKSRVKEIYDENILDIGGADIAMRNSSDLLSSGAVNLANADIVVGLDGEANFIINQLTRGSAHLDVVSIVGPPGLGKTTLAKKVYNDPAVAYHFHVQAWCSPTQEYQRRELFLDILNCIVEVPDNMHDDDIAHTLYRFLKRKRYIIVIDDFCDTEVWDDIKVSLPDDRNGSRILLTSRLRYAALQANPYGEPYPLRLLSAEESWELLQQKIFLREACTPELLEVGKLISVRCKGIPLAVVLTAGHLARKDFNYWKQVSKSHRSEIYLDLLKDVFEYIYRHLPNHLKPCFLYFGAFPVNREISVVKLFRLWIAEGFLQNPRLKQMEDLAEDYLADLIGRNLVTIAKRSSSGGIKACRIHDMLWDLCIGKAKEENFFQRIHGHHLPQLSYPLTYEQRRLCLYVEGKHLNISRSSTPCVRSLLCSISRDMNPKSAYDVSSITSNFKLLRVLDMESINMGNSFPEGLELLELLRYLAVSGNVNSVPASILNLWNLETLIVKGFRGEVALPYSFWSMQSLRHVHILPRVAFCLQDNELEDFSVLDNMISLSTPAISTGYNTHTLMRKFPNLRKLNCIITPLWDSIRKCYHSPELYTLWNLQSLKMFFLCDLLQSYPLDLNFPPHLKKLTISRFRLPWVAATAIAYLPNLEILKLQFRAFEGAVWDVEEGGFYKLKYLKLDSLNIVLLNASAESFPSLEQLILHRCQNLQEIPYTLGEIPTLQMIQVQSCGPHLENSAKQILEEQQSMGNDYLEVILDANKKL